MASNTDADASASVNEAEENKDVASTVPESDGTADEVHLATEELTTDERFQHRVERFGKVAPEAKKISRALRFGTQHEAIDDAAKKRRLERFGSSGPSTEDDQEKKRSRGERFNTNSSTASPAADNEAKQKRIDRFGVVTPSTPGSKKTANGKSAPNTPEMSEAIKKRAERFGDVSEVAKAHALNEQKAKRTERFKPVTSA